MAFDAYIKIPGVKGESAATGHTGEIHIDSFSLGANQTGTMHIATGGGASKVNVSDATFTKKLDAASPNLFQSCCVGNHYATVTMTVQKAGSNPPLIYATYTFTNCIVSGLSWSGGGEDDHVTEILSINFGQVALDYQAQDNKGNKSGGAIHGGYNIAGQAPA